MRQHVDAEVLAMFHSKTKDESHKSYKSGVGKGSL
jgi:hypothetical protein